jgi:hypothetical protein
MSSIQPFIFTPVACQHKYIIGVLISLQLSYLSLPVAMLVAK